MKQGRKEIRAVAPDKSDPRYWGETKVKKIGMKILWEECFLLTFFSIDSHRPVFFDDQTIPDIRNRGESMEKDWI